MNLSQFKAFLQKKAATSNIATTQGHTKFMFLDADLNPDLSKKIEYWLSDDNGIDKECSIIKHIGLQNFVGFSQSGAFMVAALFYFKFKEEFDAIYNPDSDRTWEYIQDNILSDLFSSYSSWEDERYYICPITHELLDTSIDDIDAFCYSIDTIEDIDENEAYLISKDEEHIIFLHNKL